MIELKDFPSNTKAQSGPNLENLNLTIYKGKRFWLLGRLVL